MSPRSDTGAGVPWRSSLLHVVLGSTLLGVLGVSLVTPILPAVGAALGVSDAAASLLITAYTLPGVFLSPVAGVLADRVGRRRVLVGSALVFSLAGVAIYPVRTLEPILVLRGVQGVGASGLFSVAVTLIGDGFEGTQRNAVLGANGAAISIGAATYPLVGGALAAVAWYAPFGVYLVGVPVAAFAARTLEGEAPAGDQTALAYLRGALDAFPAATAVRLYGALFLAFLLLFGVVFTAVPFLLAARGLTAPLIGAALTAAAGTTAVTSALNGRLARRARDRTLVAAGFACYAAGPAVAWAVPTAPGLVAGGLLFGAGQGLTVPSLDSQVATLAPARYRAGALGVRTSSIWAGTTVGPVAATAAAGVRGYGPVLLAAAAVAAVVTLALAVDARR